LLYSITINLIGSSAKICSFQGYQTIYERILLIVFQLATDL